MASQDPPLDEIQWRDPNWLAGNSGLHENTVLHYFAQSPFFDLTSNNSVLTSQAMHNQNMSYILATRSAFEGRLKTMSGLEFLIAQEPAEMAPGTGTGVWVISKQTRRKRAQEEDEIIKHASYFVVGENIYMAPTVADVLGSRMVFIIFLIHFNASNSNAVIHLHVAHKCHFESIRIAQFFSLSRSYIYATSSTTIQNHYLSFLSGFQREYAIARSPCDRSQKSLH